MNLIIFIISLFLAAISPVPAEKVVEKPVRQPQAANVLLEEINKIRKNHGRKTLIESPSLNREAQKRAEKLCRDNSWGHDEWYSYVKAAGFNYGGENLVRTTGNEYNMIEGWVNSPTHFSNIIQPRFTHTGFGRVSCDNYQGETGNILVVNLFGVRQ